MARRLVGDGAGSFLRVLTDPRSGAPLEIGRTSYRVPKAMRQWLRLAGRPVPVSRAAVTSPWITRRTICWRGRRAAGTGISNLGQPCRKHHRLRHTTALEAGGRDPGPADRAGSRPRAGRIASEGQDWEPPHWPQSLGDAGEGPATEPPDRELEPPGWETDPPDWPDILAGAVGPGGALGPGETEPPLPVDPFPGWALFIAA